MNEIIRKNLLEEAKELIDTDASIKVIRNKMIKEILRQEKNKSKGSMKLKKEILRHEKMQLKES